MESIKLRLSQESSTKSRERESRTVENFPFSSTQFGNGVCGFNARTFCFEPIVVLPSNWWLKWYFLDDEKDNWVCFNLLIFTLNIDLTKKTSRFSKSCRSQLNFSKVWWKLYKNPWRKWELRNSHEARTNSIRKKMYCWSGWTSLSLWSHLRVELWRL